jgi:heterodisulfide reductase subunit C
MAAWGAKGRKALDILKTIGYTQSLCDVFHLVRSGREGSMRIRLSAENLKSDFIKKIEELSGQNLMKCYQCGKCSAGCPFSFAMDNLPNQLVRLAQLGLEEEVANSKTVWLCASCYTCYVRCPKGVDLSKIMEAIRLLTLRKNVNRFDVEKMPKEKLSELPQVALISAMRKLTS